MKRILWMALAFVVLAGGSAAASEDYRCEVIALEGQVRMTASGSSIRSLRAGDLVNVNDSIEVGPSGYVDLALDGDAENVVRVESSSKALIRSLFPTEIRLDNGAIYAKLKNLPKESAFQVETPTAIASVRGSEYRTAIDAGGQTEVFNLSESSVYVAPLDESGEAMGEPLVLAKEQMTGVERRGERPAQARAIPPARMDACRQAQEGLERRVGEFRASGRQPKIQRMEQVKREQGQRMREHAEKKLDGRSAGGAANDKRADDRPGRREAGTQDAGGSFAQEGVGRGGREGSGDGLGKGEDRLAEIRKKLEAGVPLTDQEKSRLTQEGRPGERSRPDQSVPRQDFQEREPSGDRGPAGQKPGEKKEGGGNKPGGRREGAPPPPPRGP